MPHSVSNPRRKINPIYCRLYSRTFDLNGRNRLKNGVTDIGAFFYSESPANRVVIPTEWYTTKFTALMDAIIEAEGGNYTYTSGNGNLPFKKEFCQYRWENQGTSVILVSRHHWPKELLCFDYTGNYIADGRTYLEIFQHSFYYDSILARKTGKKARDGTELTWWHEYILGTNPTDADDYFRLNLQLDENGVPQLSWQPNLGEERTYLLFGKKEITDEWVYIADGNLTPYRFFMVKIDLQ